MPNTIVCSGLKDNWTRKIRGQIICLADAGCRPLALIEKNFGRMTLTGFAGSRGSCMPAACTRLEPARRGCLSSSTNARVGTAIKQPLDAAPLLTANKNPGICRIFQPPVMLEKYSYRMTLTGFAGSRGSCMPAACTRLEPARVRHPLLTANKKPGICRVFYVLAERESANS